MIVSFELSLGNYTRGQLHATVENLGCTKKAMIKGEKLISNSPYFHHWDDGTSASISVREVDAKEARRVRKVSWGFLGYGWMVDSILAKGTIDDS